MGNNPKNYVGKSVKILKYNIFIIRILFLLFFVGFTTVNAADKVSKTKINLQLEDVTIKSILSAIEKQTDYIFIYNVNVINSNLKKSISVKDGSIDYVLDILFDKLDVEIKIDGRQVYVLKKAKQLPETKAPVKKNNVVTGVVRDENNESVIGANVTVEGGTSGTITDLAGFFSIEASENAQLKISYVGYETKIVDVKGKNSLNVSISPTLKILDELVVVGYGLQKKSDLAGSIGQVKSDQIKNTASTDLTSALQGKVSGVYILNNSGAAGSKAEINIRGVTSLNGVSPLWIIDGVPGDQSTLNMNDVENIDIIKDGAAAAIYGVKAAAGVILVTTKRGIGQKKPRISFNTYTGLSSAWRLPEMLNSDQYITLKNEQWATSAKGVPTGLSMDSIGKYTTTNWMKEMFRQGKVQNYDLTVSGSNETSNYYIGGTYFKNEPSFIDNSIERYSFRINSDYKIAKWIKIGESVNFMYSKTNPVGADAVYLTTLLRTPPMMPVYDENNQPGGFGYVDYQDIGDFDGENPMAMQLCNKKLEHSYQLSGNAYATINILPGLSVTGTFSGSAGFGDQKTVKLPYKLSEDKKNHPDMDVFVGFSKNWSMLGNVYINYVKEFGLHNINLMAGYEASKYAGTYLNAGGLSVKYNLPVLDNVDTKNITAGGNEYLGRSLSQFGRFNYQYANKYIAQFIVRRDGSDKFGPKNRYGIFPSVSFAWKLSEEEFIKKIPTISFLKLRGTYGVNGNDNIGQYNYYSLMAPGQYYPFGTYNNITNIQGIIRSRNVANPYIQWERSKQLDLGLELGLFKNALFFNIEPYIKSVDQMLFAQPLSLSSGFADFQSNPYQVINTGLISNRGLDFSVTYKGKVGEFQYSIGGNISTFNYTVDELLDNNPILASGVLASGEKVSKTTVGESSAYFFGYQCDGIFQTQEQVDEYNNNARDIALEKNPNLTPSQLSDIYYNSKGTAPGDLIYKDIDGDGVITVNDKEKLGTPWPKATYGLQFTANYKGIDMLLTSAGVYGKDVFNASKASLYQFGSYDYSTSTMALTRWTPENHSTTNFRIDGTDPNKNMSNPSSWYIEDGSFFRIKNLELGYTIPSVWTNKAGISRLRVFVSGQNLLTLTNYTGFDPEFGMGGTLSAGVDGGTYPQSKVYTMGLQVEF